MGEVEEPRVILLGVRLEIEQVVDLVGRRHAPPFKEIKDIERRKHPIPIGGDLKGANIKVVCHPRKVLVQGQSGPLHGCYDATRRNKLHLAGLLGYRARPM